ncbi:MAG: hypothetical protein KAU12_04875 [Candidatus Omnitrophica bacterium]|nr:hypothetical protein [Candidatus Omnitrophota bacterium]
MKCLLLVLLLGILLPLPAYGEVDILDQAKAGKISQGEFEEYVLSLDEKAVLALAGQAYAKGWSDYSVTLAILGPGFEAKNMTFTREKMLSIMKNDELHPGVRSSMAVQLLYKRRYGNLDSRSRLEDIDEVLTFMEDKEIDYYWKEDIPITLFEEIQRRGKSMDTDPSEVVDELHIRVIRMMEYFIAFLEDSKNKYPEYPNYLALSGASSSLSRYAGWYLSGELSQGDAGKKGLSLAREARGILVTILKDTEYNQDAACAVLECAEEAKLDEILSEDTIAKLKQDKCFSDHKYQQMLDRLEYTGQTSKREKD